ncbi:MAG: WD40/YVTN/BNR-like repeat-containing protein [Chthoniobacterales bacterium]
MPSKKSKQRKPVSRKKSAPARERAPKATVTVRESGPRKWLFPILESAYTALAPRDGATKRGLVRPKGRAGGKRAVGTFRSHLQPGQGENVLASPDENFWLDRLREYKQRKAASFITRAARGPMIPGAVVPGAKNWTPLGPSVVLNGQAQGFPSVGGRVSGIAIAPGGNIVYVASANGGVFRSNDAGQSWSSCMDAFDLDPTSFASTSLACGAIAIDPNDPNRIYVGTGEGDTYAIFSDRIVNALPAYRGIGPIRSDDGGATWVVEDTAAGSPGLAGKAFFALAVDPTNRENVIAATTNGLYQRVINAGKPQWVRRRAGVHSSVVATFSGGSTRFFAAEWGKGVFQSTNGQTWSGLVADFPTSGVGRIALGVQANNRSFSYAFVADQNGLAMGIYRRDSANGFWKKITNAPDVLPSDNGSSQGDYDLAIAVDPNDANLIYIGGSYFADGNFWPASVWRCRVQPSGNGYSFASATSIGVRAHADVHVLKHAPNDSKSLWVGCDGGAFLNRDPKNSANFGSRNNGLACLCPTFFAQHPTDPNVLFCGLQDNGTARTAGGSVWKHVNWGDGGYCLINWATPQQVLVFANGTVYRATDGGLDHNSWTAKQFPWAMMTEPIVSTPYNPAATADAKLVALGSAKQIGSTQRCGVYLSTDFGATWPTFIQLPTTAGVYSLTFASAMRFFVGTAAGEVFRVTRSGASWNITRIDNVSGHPLGLQGLISDVAIDWADASLNSVYVCFGGVGDARRVWHFDGAGWEARSGLVGASSGNLLDVEHNALCVDPIAPNNVYVGADIGVWHSADRGHNWEPLPNGLPDAPIFDLQIHPTRRLLRCTTHGRGLYEYAL